MKNILGIVVLSLLLISNIAGAKTKDIGNGLKINIPKKYKHFEIDLKKIMSAFPIIKEMIDENEIDEIKNFYLDLYPNGNFSEAFEELKDWTSHKESFNPFINIINSNCTKRMKIEILSNIWDVILSDDNVDQYENSLFMQIGEMLLISKEELLNIQS